MKLFSLKPSKPTPSAPVTSMVETRRMPAPHVTVELCQQARVGDLPAEATDRWQAYRRELEPSPSTEDLLSFSLHKHALRGLDRRQQEKVFRRLGTLLPQPFRLSEVGAHARPPVLRQQLMAPQEALAKAGREHERALAELEARCRQHTGDIADKQRHIDALEADVAEQKRRIIELRQQHEEGTKQHAREQEALRATLEQVHEQLRDVEQLVEFERETTRNFVAAHLAWPTPSREREGGRRRPLSMFGSRPISLTGEVGTMTPSAESTDG